MGDGGRVVGVAGWLGAGGRVVVGSRGDGREVVGVG